MERLDRAIVLKPHTRPPSFDHSSTAGDEQTFDRFPFNGA